MASNFFKYGEDIQVVTFRVPSDANELARKVGSLLAVWLTLLLDALN